MCGRSGAVGCDSGADLVLLRGQVGDVGHVGSAYYEAELEMLGAMARQWMAG